MRKFVESSVIYMGCGKGRKTNIMLYHILVSIAYVGSCPTVTITCSKNETHSIAIIDLVEGAMHQS